MLKNWYKQLNELNSSHHIIALIVIITLGLLLRLYLAIIGEGYHYFSIKDEVVAFEVALSFLAGDHNAYYIGQPSFANGYAPGPVWTLYWVSLLELANHSVHRAIIFTAIINSTVIYLTYRLAKHFLNPAFALFATLIIATSPWSVYYSVGLWNPFPMAMFGALLILALWNTITKENSVTIFWLGLITAVIPQFHMIGIFYIPTIILILILSPARISRTWLFAGIFAGIALYIPYIIGDYNNNWENTRQIFSTGKRFTFSVLKILSAPISVLSNHPGRWAGDGFKFYVAFANSWFGSYIVLLIINLFTLIMGLVFIVKFLTPFFRVIKNNWKTPKTAFSEHTKLLFIGALLVFPLLTFLITGHNYGSRYTIIIFPLLYLLPAFYLQNNKSTKFKRFYIFTLPFIIFVNFYLILGFYADQSNQLNSDDYFVASFKKMESVQQSIKQHAGPNVFITIDVTKFMASAPDKLEKSAMALKLYVDAIEKHQAHSEKPEVTKSYILQATTEKDKTDNSIAYQDNVVTIKTKN